jgi:sigma-B regulation protein RsbU (phosphoserine phosphatase)
MKIPQNSSNRKLDQKLLEISTLFEFSQTLNSSLDIPSILDNMMLAAMGKMMLSRSAVLFHTTNNHYTVRGVKGLSGNLINLNVQIDNPIRSPLLHSKEKEDSPFRHFLAENKLELVLPLNSRRKFSGLMALGAKLNGETFSSEEIQFLESLNNIALQAIENALGFDEVNAVNRKLDIKIQELKALFEVGHQLNGFFEESVILKQFSYSLMGQLLINQFFVTFMKNGKFSVIYARGSQFGSNDAAQLLKRFISLKLERSKDIIKCSQDHYESLYKAGVRLIVPMNSQNTTSGYLFLGDKLDGLPLAENQYDFLITMANLALMALENARLFKETVEKKKLEEELNVAHAIQKRLLPAGMPNIRGYDIHGFNVSSKQVGGDYFDILKINDNEYILTIADVSGKGMPASLLMSNLQAGLQILSYENKPLSNITYQLNNLIYNNTSVEKYITFFILKMNISGGEYEYVNAGHNPPYIFDDKGNVTSLDIGGIILGMMANMPYETGYGKLAPKQCLTMFTDGVTEALNPENEEYGEKRVINFFTANYKQLNAKNLNDKLFNELNAFSPIQTDDITVLTLKRL